MEETGARQKPGRFPGRKVLIAGVIVVVILIAAGAAYLFFQVPQNSESPAPQETANPGSQDQVPAVSTTEETAQPAETPPQTTEVQTTEVTVTGTVQVPVDFVLQPGELTSCGLTCRQLVAAITNTGYETAHNVCITIALHNDRNEVINLNGDPSLRQCIGDIAGGQEKSEPITINADCGAFATRCIGETLTLQTQVSSDEKTIQFPDQQVKV